jgi:hypothetical protein
MKDDSVEIYTKISIFDFGWDRGLRPSLSKMRDAGRILIMITQNTKSTYFVEIYTNNKYFWFWLRTVAASLTFKNEGRRSHFKQTDHQKHE